MGLNDINSLSQSLPPRVYKKELQISHSICAEVSQKNLLQRKPCGNREDIERIMQLETSENSRGGSVSGSYPHAGGNTA